MATTKIMPSRNGRSSINYVLQDKPHYADDTIQHRALVVSGQNVVSSNAKDINGMMSTIWSKKNTRGKNQIETYNIIQSFSKDEFDYRDEMGWYDANQLGRELAKSLYPDRQVLVVTQADNENHMVHNHLIVNSLDPINGKALRGEQTRHWAVAKANDEVLKAHGMQPVPKPVRKHREPQQAQRQIVERGGYSWMEDLTERVKMATETARDVPEFKRKLKDMDVDVRERGHKYSYAFTDEDGKQRKVRQARLPEDLSLELVQETLQKNRQKEVTNMSYAGDIVSVLDGSAFDDRLKGQPVSGGAPRVPLASQMRPRRAPKQEIKEAPKKTPSVPKVAPKATKIPTPVPPVPTPKPTEDMAMDMGFGADDMLAAAAKSQPKPVRRNNRSHSDLER